MPDDDGCAPLICGLLFGVLVGIFIGLLFGNDTINGFKDEATTRGHAEYYLDENHTALWRWKDDGCVMSNRAEVNNENH